MPSELARMVANGTGPVTVGGGFSLLQEHERTASWNSAGREWHCASVPRGLLQSAVWKKYL